MNFSPNKTSIEIKKGAFGGTYFRDICSGINEKWYKYSWKEFVHLKNIDAKFQESDYYDVNVNKYGAKCGTSLRFWESKGWINRIDPYSWFDYYGKYYGKDKEAMKEKSRERYKNLSQEEKEKIKQYQREKYQELVQYKKEVLRN